MISEPYPTVTSIAMEVSQPTAARSFYYLEAVSRSRHRMLTIVADHQSNVPPEQSGRRLAVNRSVAVV